MEIKRDVYLQQLIERKDNGISIFAVSTYNTDYVLIKKENYQKALEVLQTTRYKITD